MRVEYQGVSLLKVEYLYVLLTFWKHILNNKVEELHYFVSVTDYKHENI